MAAEASSPPAHKRTNSLFSKLKRTLSMAPEKEADDTEPSGSDAVEKQTEASRQEGTIWDIVRKADEKALADLLDRDPKKVEARGFVGECPIHMCFLYASPAHLNLAKYIIQRFPDSIHQTYDKAEYQGENVLHISVINKNAQMVEWLLTGTNAPYADKLMRAAATGNFFKLGSPCYYGEYPLAFAACTNQWELVEILIRHGADMDMVDSNGNNVLHLLVIHNLPDVYSKYKKLWIDQHQAKMKALADKKEAIPTAEPLWKRMNGDHLTPLTLAAKMGQKEMFAFLLDERKITQWTYGPVSCVLYPLDQLDLGLRTGDGDQRAGALELIVNDAHVKLLMHPRLVDLVNTKWERFASRVFRTRFLSTLAYLFVFMMTTILGQTRYESEVTGPGGDLIKTVEHPTGLLYWLRIAGDAFVLGGAAWKGRREINEMMNMGVREYFSTSGSGLLENTLACTYCFCIFVVNILRLMDMPAQSAVLALASIAGWTYMLFFLMAFRLTGPFVVMIHQMLFNDVLRFCIIYAVFLAGFSQAFFVLFDSNGLGGFLGSVKQCFFGMLGDFEVDTYAETTFQYVSVSLLIIYVVVVTILLLNLLIAMMGDTYGNVIEGATELWHLERARIVFAIENEMSTDERNLEQNKYWTTVDGERYLQVQEVNPDHFRDKKKDTAAAPAAGEGAAAAGDDDKKA